MIERDDRPGGDLFPDLIENIPGVAFRFSHKDDCWKTWFVTQNISMYGYNADDFMSDRVRWMDIVHPDDRVLLSKSIDDYEKHGINSFKLYYRLITSKGDSIPVTEYNTVNRDKDGNIICYDTIVISNSQDEASRRLIDDHYRQQVVLNDILMSLHDSDLGNALQIILDRTGEYLDTSRALLFKDSPDHKTCKIVYEWCNKDIASVMALDYSITYETGMPEIYIALQTTGNLLINYGEIPENCKEEFDAEGLVASAIFAVYLNGDHYGFVCFDDCIVERTWDHDTVRFLKNIANIISTVLARQDAAQKLAKNQRTYEAVLDNVDSYIFVTSQETDAIVFANKAFKSTFCEDCIGKNAEDYIRFREATYSGLELPEAAGTTSVNYPEIFCEKSGEWLAVSSEEMDWIDGKKVLLVNCYDITSKKILADTLEEKIRERTRELQMMSDEAERARQKAEDATLAKSQFLANMSHEIRTPMNAILGLSELMSEADLSTTQLEHVRNIRRSSGILLNIINDILDISKLEAGKLALVEVHFNLLQTLDHVTSLMRVMAEARGIDFVFTTNASLSISLFGDDIRLRQILINILGNAVKFTEKGQVELKVDLNEEDIVFTISDTGIGISEEGLKVIFEPFTQSDTHKNRNIQGTGLGLPICKSLVELMGGSIKAESVYGKGSVFTVTIPRVAGSGEQVEQDVIPAQHVYAPDAKVLVIDDIDVNLYVIEALLENYGIQTFMATSAAEGIKLIQETDFDLVFMDHMMPVMNGVEATRLIRGMGKKYQDLPIIALTANAVAEARQLFSEAGMDDFISKPIEPVKLNILLEKWLPESKIIKS